MDTDNRLDELSMGESCLCGPSLIRKGLCSQYRETNSFTWLNSQLILNGIPFH